MSEKRFKVVQDPRVQTEYFIYDNENKISRNITDYPFINQDVCSKIVMLLNEQQSIIDSQNELLDEIFMVFQKYGIETGYNKRILEIALKELRGEELE